MQDDSAQQHFRIQKERFFKPLCEALGLAPGEAQQGTGFAVVSAIAGHVRVFFEHDCGLCFFSVGAAADAKALCGVEEFAERFPRLRALEGAQRLSLAEQRAFLERNWRDIQLLFSPEQHAETRRWADASAAAYTDQMARKQDSGRD